MGKTKIINQKTIYRYSATFKQKVVSEIENGNLSIYEARKKYDIKGTSTIQRWLQKMGKNELLCKRVRIETIDEMSVEKKLKARIAELEKGLVSTQLAHLSAESYLLLACEELGLSVETFKKKQIKGTS